MGEPRVYTIGHSTRPIEEFVTMLRANDVRLVADVRTVPKSRHNPQFAEDALRVSLPEAGIGYRRLPGLGGLRHTTKASALASPNGAWRNASFRGYADYMQTPAFANALDELIGVAVKQPTAIMCAEAVPWRCHRSLVGDALLARGIAVFDIMSETSTKPHGMTRFAHVEGTRVTYPGEDGVPA
ncbi:DUF488 domain-containing protein [Microbacterium sp. STN6]|uniref:DUF488 domain-containing protein n=1 Tax=Microbacterium sp. STN6 TaxID=2995588 RepID=UPI002260DFF5|nr:DUF488 domain-containing protein [Microbacterium sp. STN6]MCX7522599.1 DUF488 domain-containing protein [Microbacterium sp. STN6]